MKTSKTQISNLINGCKDVARILTNEKYLTAAKSINGDYVGSSTVEREIVSAGLKRENTDCMKVEILGKEYRLDTHKSLSGKTWWWSCIISEEAYKEIGNTHLGLSEKYENQCELMIYQDGKVQIFSSNRKNEKATFKNGYSLYIDEALVTIK